MLTLLLCITQSVLAQQDSIPPKKEIDSLRLEDKDSLLKQSRDTISKDSTKRGPKGKGLDGLKSKEKDSVGIGDYKIISYGRDTTFVDTTLTIKKEYKYNYLRKDDFELMP